MQSLSLLHPACEYPEISEEKLLEIENLNGWICIGLIWNGILMSCWTFSSLGAVWNKSQFRAPNSLFYNLVYFVVNKVFKTWYLIIGEAFQRRWTELVIWFKTVRFVFSISISIRNTNCTVHGLIRRTTGDVIGCSHLCIFFLLTSRERGGFWSATDWRRHCSNISTDWVST